MGDLACINGELTAVEQAKVSVLDRGFLFGDSVYEVCRIYNGRCWLETQHRARLKRSLKELDFPPYDVDRLLERIYRTIRAGFIKEGLVYVQVTRGVAPRTHAFPDPPVDPTEVIIVRPYDDAPTAARRATGVPVVSHPDLRWKRCDIKSTNLLANVLAIETARRAGAFEAVLIDADGYVTEATHTSLLWVREGRLEGTPEGPEILIGMTRHLAQRLAAEIGLPFVEARITLAQLLATDEAILVGTSTEILPVSTVDGQKIGTGKPGPIARRLQTAYEASLDAWLADGNSATPRKPATGAQ
ncbi:MAG: aminotransferase class IV [Paludisphaera borealis]|uniref:aminotransferase class IV n=1 Tax=Paludisphaera borealis TaxID=1387353 RepID=UPI0028466918|nr:aminotransferase class IV [Paludisphaera borealis]MDR3620319.1 aminotransferase class IV [Paludisphaera borealis]